MLRRLLLCCFGLMILMSHQLIAQSKVVTGTVISSEDQTTMPGVTILIKGTQNGTATDIDGKFSIKASDTDVLVFSFIGFNTQEVPVGQQSVINITLTPKQEILDEVVIVAYGFADKKSFTGSLAEISAKSIEKRPISNVSNALAGTVAGLQTNVASGQPGSAPDIRIRGIGSVSSSSSPLFVVDGVPYDQGISNLNPNDIESISVLKDAASSALYGSRAANGVVIITTKKGESGDGKLNLSITQGVTSRAIPEYDRVSAQQYYPLMWEAYRNSLSISGTTPTATANQMASDNISTLLGYNPFNVAGNQVVLNDGTLNPAASLLYDDFDWFEPLERTGRRQEFNLNYSGGNEKTNYFVSLGYLNEEGYIVNSDFDRYTARINVNTSPKTWMKTGLNISMTYSEGNNAQTGTSNAFVNPFNFARNIGPIYPVYEHDPVTGDLILDGNGNKVYDLGFGPPARPSGASPGRHIVQETLLNKDLFKRTVVSGRSYVEATFLKDFTFRANVAADLYSYYEATYDNKIVGDGAPDGRASRFSSTEFTITLNQLLTYRKTFNNKHNLEVLLGHESYEFLDYGFSGSRQGQIVDGNNELVNFTTTNSLTSSVAELAREGYFSRLGYDFDGKYFLSASFRRDGSSKFSEDSRWGNFFSVGASWRVETENFMENIEWVDALKVRTSYGEVGNDALPGFFPNQGLYGLGFNNVDEPGYLQSTLSANDLQWETNSTFTAGVDFILFGDRVSGTIEYYNRKSSNLLFEVPLPLSTGVENVPQNIGAMFNKGIEIQLEGDVLKKGNFTWNLNVNASTFKNEITKLPQEEIINGTKKLTVGSSIYDYWLRDYYGVDPENGDALFRTDDFDPSEGVVIGNDSLTTDPSNARFHYSKSAIPDVFGGITNTFTYKNLSLSILATYQIGGYAYDNGYQTLMGGPNYGDAIHADIVNRWQKPGDITDVPRLDVSKNPNSGATSDRWLVDASYLNIRQITLNYNFGSTLLSKFKVSNASAYVSAENLKLFSERKGLNVIQNFSGVTSNAYIPSRVISVGLNLGF